MWPGHTLFLLPLTLEQKLPSQVDSCSFLGHSSSFLIPSALVVGVQPQRGLKSLPCLVGYPAVPLGHRDRTKLDVMPQAGLKRP